MEWLQVRCWSHGGAPIFVSLLLTGIPVFLLALLLAAGIPASDFVVSSTGIPVFDFVCYRPVYRCFTLCVIDRYTGVLLCLSLLTGIPVFYFVCHWPAYRCFTLCVIDRYTGVLLCVLSTGIPVFYFVCHYWPVYRCFTLCVIDRYTGVLLCVLLTGIPVFYFVCYRPVYRCFTLFVIIDRYTGVLLCVLLTGIPVFYFVCHYWPVYRCFICFTGHKSSMCFICMFQCKISRSFENFKGSSCTLVRISYYQVVQLWENKQPIIRVSEFTNQRGQFVFKMVALSKLYSNITSHNCVDADLHWWNNSKNQNLR
jgi:hypothetical protein